MALLIREEDVRSLVTISDALDTTELALSSLAAGTAVNEPRHRLVMPDGVLHTLAGSMPALGVYGFKAYSTSRRGARFAVWLYQQGTGELLAIVESDLLGQLRTGAASGVATKYLARPEAHTLGVFGAGNQARTQIMAVAKVRPLTSVSVTARRRDRLQRFCSELTDVLELPVTPAQPEEAAAQDIVCTVTSSTEPVCLGTWLAEGAHVNAAGSNWADRRELDDMAIARSAVIACDDLAQARLEAGDLIAPILNGTIVWDQVYTLGEVITGARQGRTASHSVTLFKSLGIGVEDVALAALVLERAQEQDVGEVVELLGTGAP